MRLNEINRLIQNILLYIGIQIKKVDNFAVKPNKIVQIIIGKYELEINSRNPISIHYKKFPNYGIEIGRISKIIANKYPSMSIIDIGANIGDTAAIIRNQVDNEIICIEGDEYCFNFLEKNIKQLKKTLAFRQFLGEKNEEMNVKIEKSKWNTTIIPQAGISKETLDIKTLDSFLKKNLGDVKSKFIKIDTEGFDVKIIRGGVDFIMNNKPVIFFEYNRKNMNKINEKGIDTIHILRDLGYNNILFYEDGGNFIISSNLNNDQVLNQMHNWINNSSSVDYFDIAIFHSEDNDISMQLIEIEMQKNN